MENLSIHLKLLWEFAKEAGDVPVTEWKKAAGLFRLQSLKKGECFFRAGEKASRMGILTKGSAFVYYEMGDGSHLVRRFFEVGDRCGSYPAVVHANPTPDTFEALEDSTILSIDYAELKKLMASHICWERMVRRALEKEVEEREARELELFSMSLEERYNSFRQRRPQIVKKVPKKLLASYLGVTPEAFSRLLSQLAK